MEFWRGIGGIEETNIIWKVINILIIYQQKVHYLWIWMKHIVVLIMYWIEEGMGGIGERIICATITV